MTQESAESPQSSALTPPARKPVERSPLWSVLATIAAAASLTFAVGSYSTQTETQPLFATTKGAPAGVVVEVVHDHDGNLHAHPCPDGTWGNGGEERSDLTAALDACVPAPAEAISADEATAKRAVVLSLDWSSVPSSEDPVMLARSYVAEAHALQLENPSLLIIPTTAPAATPPWESLDASTPTSFSGHTGSPESDEITAARHSFNEEVRAACIREEVFLDLDAIEVSASATMRDPAHVSEARTTLLQQRLQEIIVATDKAR